MFKILKLSSLLLIFLTANALSHVEHYSDLKYIEFDIYRNNKNIGKHKFTFKKVNNQIFVSSNVNFIIKKLGVTLYKYEAKGTEIFEDGKLVRFNSKTNQNRKEKYVNIDLVQNEYIIDGSSHKGKTSDVAKVGTWWNHNLVEAPAQISAVSGRIIKQKVKFLGKKQIEINGKTFETLHFNFSSTDNKLGKGKKLNTDVWYEEKTLNWIKASFKKKGLWEYKLLVIK